VDYQAEFELFSHYQNEDAWNHAANVRFRHTFSGRLSIDGAETFLSTMDPTRRLVNSLLLLPRGRYNESDFYTRLAYRLDRKTVLSGRFDTAFTSMDLPADLQVRLDRVGYAGTVNLDHTFNNHHSISADYAYLYVQPLANPFHFANTTAHTAGLGYIYTVNPGLVLRASGGVTKSVQSSFTGAAAVDKKIKEAWVSLGYQRYLGFLGGLTPTITPVAPVPFGTTFGPSSIYQVVALRAWGKITNRFGLEGDVQRALNGVTADNRGIKSVILQLRLDYKINNRVTVFTRTEFYGQNVSEFENFPVSRRRYFAGLEFTLARAPELTDGPRRHKRSGAPDEKEGEGHSQEDR
jgi:hypothetical protein